MLPAVDFGCQHASIAAAMPGALLVVLLFFLLSGMGSVVGGRTRWAPADVISGWGIVTILFTIGGVFLPGFLPVFSVMAGVAALATIGVHILTKKCVPWTTGFIIAVVTEIWILAAINHAGISGWDDIAQWTPNALFLWRHDSFPAAGFPIYSNRPAYPYGLAYLDYLTSLGQGGFVVQAGAMINWLLLAVFAWALTAFDKTERPLPAQIMRFFLALSFVTILNPGFNASFTVTGQSDTATSVIVGFLGLLLLHLQEALRSKERSKTKAIAWQIAMASATLVQLRDMNIILLMLLASASLLVALRDKNFIAGIRIWIPSAIPAIALFVVWRIYCGRALAQNGPPPILPLAEWHWQLVPQLLGAAGKEMLKKNGFYALMLITSGFGVRAFLRGKLNRIDTLAVLAGVTFSGYCVFNLIAFIGSSFFSEHNIVNAMSFFRYGTHVGLLGIAMLWFLYERYAEPRTKPRAVIGIGVTAFALLPVAFSVKAAWLVPQPGRALCMTREFGDDLAQRLPPGSHLAILDNEGNGFESYIINLGLALDDLRTGHQSRVVTYTNEFENEKLPDVMAQISGGMDINSVLLKHPSPELQQSFGVAGDQPTYLVLRGGTKWHDIGTGLPPDSAP